MLSMFDVLIDVGGRDRWDGDPDPRHEGEIDGGDATDQFAS
jgi:hypothetical protein